MKALPDTVAKSVAKIEVYELIVGLHIAFVFLVGKDEVISCNQLGCRSSLIKESLSRSILVGVRTSQCVFDNSGSEVLGSDFTSTTNSSTKTGSLNCCQIRFGEDKTLTCPSPGNRKSLRRPNTHSNFAPQCSRIAVEFMTYPPSKGFTNAEVYVYLFVPFFSQILLL